MDVLKKLFLISFVVLFLFGCNQNNTKTSDNVFPGQKPNNDDLCYSQAIKNKFIVEWEDGRTTVETYSDKDLFVEEFLKPQLDKIKYVEFDSKLERLPTDSLHSYEAPDTTWGQETLKVQEVWSLGIEGQDIIVAVTDSGIDPNHALLKNQIALNEKEIPNNGIDDDENGKIDDYMGWNFYDKNSDVMDNEMGHGTHVSGIIAAEYGLSSVYGVAPKAKILPLKFMGEHGDGNTSDAIQAIIYAAERGARVINASWGGAPCSVLLKETIEKVASKNVLFITASGNDGIDIDSYPQYPASYKINNLITVGSIGQHGWVSTFSNFGLDSVHILAPGDLIFSTFPGNYIGGMSGTSMAAPFVSGAAALLWSSRPQATATQIREALLSSVDIHSSYSVSSHGRLNILKAVDYLQQLLPE